LLANSTPRATAIVSEANLHQPHPAIDSVFVYGTLKQHQLRAGVWPHRPLRIRPATIQATMYDVGPYPAIGPGSNWVLGELWTLDQKHMPTTLAVLDAVEGYDALGKDNQYIRLAVEAVHEGGSMMAYTYQFADTKSLQRLRQIEAHREYLGRSCQAWPDPKSRVPRSIEEE
jgi:gamma-glutamylcyclotransferase (GGCT)/AIG2-like uncharacterized protein YtfP